MPVAANEHDLRTGMSVPHYSGALAENGVPVCADDDPILPQGMHKGEAAGEWNGRDARPHAVSAVTDC